jgi:hypothetical protein
MKVSIVLFILVVGVALGYLMATEDGRRRRDELIAKLRQQSPEAADAVQSAVDAADAQLSA